MPIARLLVVEDDILIARHLRLCLEKLGYTVIGTVSSGEEALGLADECSLDLVFMDIALNGALDGIETASQLRARCDLPVVYLTAYADPRTLERAGATGPYGYIVKPFSEDSLRATVEMALAKHRLEAQLKASEERYHTLVDQAADGIFIADLRGNFVEVNPSGCDMLGYSREELLQMNMDNLLAAEDLAANPLPLAALLRGDPVIQERRLRCKDGIDLPAEINAKQLPGGWLLGIVRDVSQRNRAEVLLRERNAALQASAEALERRNAELTALNAIAAALRQPRDLEANLSAALEQTLAVTRAEAGCIHLLENNASQLALSVEIGLPAELAAAWRVVPVSPGAAGQVLLTRAPFVFDCGTVHASTLTGGGTPGPDPGVDYQSCAVVPLESQDHAQGSLSLFGRLLGSLDPQAVQLLGIVGHEIGTAIENTRLARDAAEIQILQALNQLRSELIANVSHELRTPLGLIKIFCTTLLRQDVMFEADLQREFLLDINRETERLEGIVDNLLDLSRLESRRLRLDRQMADVGRLCRETIARLAPQLSPQHHFVDGLPDEPLYAPVDARRLEQVLRNLISNAVKYSPLGGEIAIRACAEAHQILVWISDPGVGIPLEAQEYIFERFFRVENELTRQVNGTGLGLPVCKGIIEAHGGRIWVESEPEAGSTFYFTLPRRVPAGENLPEEVT